MALSDVLAGFSEAAHQHNQNLLEMQYRNNNMIGEMLGKMAENPNLLPEQQSALFQEAIKAHATPYGKEYKGAYDPKTHSVSLPVSVMSPVKPPAPPPMSVGGQPGPTGPTAGMVSAGSPESSGASPLPQVGVNPQSVQPPTPPQRPEMRDAMQPMSYQERLALEQNQKEMEFGFEKRKLLLQQGAVKQLGKTQTIDPDGTRHSVILQQRGTMGPNGEPQVDETGRPVLEISRIKDPDALPPFAQRFAAAGAIPIGSALKSIQSGTQQFNDNMGKPYTEERLKALMDPETGLGPQVSLHPTDSTSNRWIAVNDRMGVFHADGGVWRGSPFEEKNLAQYIGQETSTLPKTTEAMRPVPGMVDTRTGGALMAPSTSTRTTQLPGNVPRGTTAGATGLTPTPPPMSVGGQAGTAKPSQEPVSPKAPSPPPSRGTVPLDHAMPASQFQKQKDMVVPIREVAASLISDPAKPEAQTIDQLGSLAINPSSRQKIATAVDSILHDRFKGGSPDSGIGVGPITAHFGEGWQVLKNITGLQNEITDQEVKAMQSKIGTMSPEERGAVNQIIAFYGNIPGLRVATKGSAYQFYITNLEKEIPTFGNVASGGDFYQKIGLIARDIVNATSRSLHPDVMPDDEKQRYADAESRYFKLAKLNDAELGTWHSIGKYIRYKKNGTGEFVVK